MARQKARLFIDVDYEGCGGADLNVLCQELSQLLETALSTPDVLHTDAVVGDFDVDASQELRGVLADCNSGVLPFRVEKANPDAEPGNKGLAIYLEQHGTVTRDPGYGAVVFLEYGGGQPRLHVWADIREEDPTVTINLSGAHESRRLVENG